MGLSDINLVDVTPIVGGFYRMIVENDRDTRAAVFVILGVPALASLITVFQLPTLSDTALNSWTTAVGVLFGFSINGAILLAKTSRVDLDGTKTNAIEETNKTILYSLVVGFACLTIFTLSRFFDPDLAWRFVKYFVIFHYLAVLLVFIRKLSVLSNNEVFD